MTEPTSPGPDRRCECTYDQLYCGSAVVFEPLHGCQLRNKVVFLIDKHPYLWGHDLLLYRISRGDVPFWVHDPGATFLRVCVDESTRILYMDRAKLNEYLKEGKI